MIHAGKAVTRAGRRADGAAHRLAGAARVADTAAAPPWRRPPTARTARTLADIDPRRREVPANRPGRDAGRGPAALAAACWALASWPSTSCWRHNTQLLGLAIGGTLAMLAAAAIVAGKLVVPQETSVEQRDQLLDEEQVERVVEMIEAGGEGISRRKLLVGAGGLAGAAVVTAAATPLASLGPAAHRLHDTPWHRGVRLVDDRGSPYPADEIQIGASTRRCRRARARRASAPACWWSGCPRR